VSLAEDLTAIIQRLAGVCRRTAWHCAPQRCSSDRRHEQCKPQDTLCRERGCVLGPVRDRRHPGARIAKQYRPAHKVLPAGTEVGVKLAR